MKELSKAQIDKLKKEHGEVHMITLTDGTKIYFKPLGRVVNSELQKKVQGLSLAGGDEVAINDTVEEDVIAACLLEPSVEEFKALHDLRAGVRTAVVEQIYAVSGFVVLGTPQKL
jgi:hypothetical protein